MTKQHGPVKIIQLLLFEETVLLLKNISPLFILFIVQLLVTISPKNVQQSHCLSWAVNNY